MLNRIAHRISAAPLSVIAAVLYVAYLLVMPAYIAHEAAKRDVVAQGTAGTLPKFSASSTITDSIVKESAGKLGINTAPLYALDARGSVPYSLESNINTDATGTSAIDYYDEGTNYKCSMGWANSAAVAASYIRNHPYVFVAGAGAEPDFLFANGSRNNVTLGMAETKAFVEVANGAGAAVSPANTARLRYNAGHLEVSLNGAAYAIIL